MEWGSQINWLSEKDCICSHVGFYYWNLQITTQSEIQSNMSVGN
jgi:hypothetical protein